MTNRETKVCRVCQKTLPVDEFFRDSHNKDGFMGICKKCQAQYRRNRYANNPGVRERQRLAHLKWQKEHPGRIKDYTDNNPDKVQAKSAINSLTRSGKIPRAKDCKCVTCGEQAYDYHHHRGYLPEHWGSVIPLCRACHKQEHLAL